MVYSMQHYVYKAWHGVLNATLCIIKHGVMYSIKHYVIKFVSDLRQVGGFLRVLQYPPSIKLMTTTI